MTATQRFDEPQIRAVVLACLRQIAPEADPESLDPAVNLREALDIDSFDFLNLIIALDDELGVAVPEADYGLLATLDDMVGYLARSAA